MKALVIEGLTVGYGRRPVLEDVSLEARPGELTVLVGPNGAGKTTLVRAVSGVLRPSAGEARFGEEDLLALSSVVRARYLAVVSQSGRLPGAYKAAQVVLMGRYPHGTLWGGETQGDLEVAAEALDAVGAAHLAARRVDELSGGERQRLAVARALAQEPSVLFLDEATVHLDVKAQAEFHDLVRRLLRERGLVAVSVLHDLNQAAIHADRIGLMAGGGLRAFGSVDEVLTAELLSEAYDTPLEVARHPVHGTPLVVANSRR